MPQRSRTKAGKILTLLGSLALSLVGADLLFRVLQPAPYETPKVVEPDGDRVPISEIIDYLRSSGSDTDWQRPCGRLRPNSRFELWYDRPRWDYFSAAGTIDIKINSLGFRDLEFERQKGPGEYRVLGVGDSFTFGIGVPLEDTWVQVLEGRLGAAREGPVQVVNVGFAADSYWPPGYQEWLLSDGIALEPDLVILGFCLNDMGTWIPMLSYPVAEPEPWWGSFSAILTALEVRSRQRELKAHQLPGILMLDYDRGPWEQTQAALKAIDTGLEAAGIRFVVAVFPMMSQLADGYPMESLHTEVTDFCSAQGIECLDLRETFLGLEDESLWAHPTDQHPNDVGNRLIADRLFDYLQENPQKPR